MQLWTKRIKLLIKKALDQFTFQKIKFSQNNKFFNKISHKKTSKINIFMFKNHRKRQKHKRMIKNKANQKVLQALFYPV